MTYEQATAVTELPEVGVAEASVLTHTFNLETGAFEAVEEVFVTDEGIVGEAIADVTVH